MKNKLFLFWILISSFYSLQAQKNEESSVKKILQTQQAAWNKGDIEAYMQGYWKSDSLMFIGKNGITYGWKQTLENYKKSYADSVAMGKLDFEFVEIKRLSDNYYFVVGKWQLTRTIEDIGGSFTLLFRKIKGKWVIIRDHSS